MTSPSIRALLGLDTTQFTRLVARPTSLCRQLSGATELDALWT